MFCLNKDIELTPILLQKMIERFYTLVEPQLKKYKEYYDGIQAIANKTYKDPNKSCSRVVVNFARNIVDSYCGYLATPGFISYSSENDIEEIMNILRYNDYQSQDAELLLNALIYGVAAELMYHDEDGHTRFRTIDPTTCFGIYDDSLSGDLRYFVRIYKVNDWDETDEFAVDVYTDSLVKHYKTFSKHGYLIHMKDEPHYFSQCPANVFALPDEKSIFDCILTLQDAYNEICSSEIDDYNAFCDAYLILAGVDADPDDIAKLKEDRTMLLPTDARAEWLVKAGNDTQVENMLKRIQEAIYRIASCVDFSAETLMNGVSSGVAIRYKMCGQENNAGRIEAQMKKALQRRVEIIAGIASLKLGEEVFRDINIDFKRNIPEDYASVISVVNSLKGIVSDSTLLSQIPFIEDVNGEIERVEKQKAANMAMYNFGNMPTDDEGDEE